MHADRHLSGKNLLFDLRHKQSLVANLVQRKMLNLISAGPDHLKRNPALRTRLPQPCRHPFRLFQRQR